MTTPQITRRALLAATAVVVAARPAAAAAKTAAAPQEGNGAVTVVVTPSKEVTLLRYTITNVGSGPETFTVQYTDLKNGKKSKKHTHHLGKGKQASDELYGHLNHTFLVNVCQSDGSCYTVGPVGPAAQSPGPAVGLTVPPQ